MPLFCWAKPMIRRALPTDAPVIRCIAESAYQPFVAQLGKKPAPMVADFERHIDEDWVVVFDRDGSLLGYAILLVDDRRVLLDNIAVDANVQQQGIGAALMDHIERHVIAMGRRCYDLYTNVVMTENIRWYRKLGFVETERVTEKGFSRVYMQKVLGSDSGPDPAHEGFWPIDRKTRTF